MGQAAPSCQESPESRFSTNPSLSVIYSPTAVWAAASTNSVSFHPALSLLQAGPFLETQNIPSKLTVPGGLGGGSLGLCHLLRTITSFNLPLNSHALLFLRGVTLTQKEKTEVFPPKEGRAMVQPWGNFQIGGCATYNSL